MNAPKIRYLIRPGVHDRTILVHTVTDERTIARALEQSDLEEPLPDAAPDAVLEAFLRGIEVGCLGPVVPALSLQRQKVRQAETPSGEEVKLWSVVLPPLSEGVFAVLGHMFTASAALGSGLVRAIIEEDAVTVETTLDLGALPPPSAPFRTLFPEPAICKDCQLLMVFQRALSEVEVNAVRNVLFVWEKLVIGGFPAPASQGLSMVRIYDVFAYLEEEITCRIEMFAGGKEAWDALVRAGGTIHRDIAPLEAIEVI